MPQLAGGELGLVLGCEWRLGITPELHVPEGKAAITLMDFSPLLLICAVPLGAKRCPRCQGNKGCKAGWGRMRGQAWPSDWMEYNSLLLQQLKDGRTHPAGYLGKGAVPGTGVGPVRPAGAQACGPRACPRAL